MTKIGYQEMKGGSHSKIMQGFPCKHLHFYYDDVTTAIYTNLLNILLMLKLYIYTSSFRMSSVQFIFHLL